MRYDTLILGAGMSGLAAGIRLAQFDRRVAVLERHSLWGGLNSFYKKGGRHFDVGLHALTNFCRPGERGKPLARVLRQLRLRHADLALGEQNFSEIDFPGLRLVFTNDFERFRSEVGAAFPAQRDGFERVVRRVQAEDLGDDGTASVSARAVLETELSDPLLVDALLLPICYYGSAAEDGPDWHTFAILFRSIFLEGLCRPAGGIRPVLDLLRRRYRELGGELRMRAGVQEIRVEHGRATGVVLDDGSELEADHILSSAGWVETMRLCGAAGDARVTPDDVGQLSFLEAISVLDRRPAELGFGAATAFFCRSPRLRYRRPASLVDLDSGVVCAPDNYAADTPPAEGAIRITLLADPAGWCALPEDQYVAQKSALADAAVRAAADFFPDWNGATVFRDVFTPRTIRHYTGRVNGAVYGSPKKRLDGCTGIESLFLCGTDQGFLGVVGALMSGISMANRHVLAQTESAA